MCRLLPPVALLLLTSAGMRAADLPKAVVSLDPKWDRLLEKDNVTLQCRGAYPKEDNSTQWFHDGKPLPGQSSTYVIADARVKDSGNYSCQTASFTLSDPVELNVYADLPKAVVSLDPKWDRLLEKDNVTLQCRGAYPKEDNSTQWFHDGKPLPGQSSTYVIADARVKDSGKYSCQTASFTLSDPVQLNVYAGWLVLQAAHWVLQEGEPLQLRCHSWKNVCVTKVQYFRNGRGQQFSHKNSEFHIQHTERAHSGSYFCRGIIGKQNVSSEAVNVTVQGLAVPAVSPFFLLWQMAFCLVMGLLFAVDTRLYFSVQKELRSSLRKKGNDKVTWSKSP